MENSEFKRLLQEKTAAINGMLERFLPAETGEQRTIMEAMNYSVRVGGKRLRPMLLWESFLLCGGEEKAREVVEPFMAALEMIHTYSLIHDDLPAMDNDEYRRGRKTTWAVYGEAMGILAGDGLLNYAFETVAEGLALCTRAGSPCSDGEALSRAVSALSVLTKKAGIYGMIGGQTADIEAEGKRVTERQLVFIHEHKTAALIQAAMMIGALLAGADDGEVEAMEKCAYNIGVAFQIQDDILDVVGDSVELGKQVGSDAQNEKQTYVSLKGLKQAETEVTALSEEAVRILDGFERKNPFLRQLVLELIHRRK